MGLGHSTHRTEVYLEELEGTSWLGEYVCRIQALRFTAKLCTAAYSLSGVRSAGNHLCCRRDPRKFPNTGLSRSVTISRAITAKLKSEWHQVKKLIEYFLANFSFKSVITEVKSIYWSNSLLGCGLTWFCVVLFFFSIPIAQPSCNSYFVFLDIFFSCLEKMVNKQQLK